MSPEPEDYDQQVSDNDYELPPPDSLQPEEANDRPNRPSRAERPVVSTLANIVSIFADFLTVAIHTILYERQIYSPDLFISTRAYNHPVRQARHPALCKWIQDAVEACSAQTTEGKVSRISLVVLSPNDFEPLERFVWDVSSFPMVPTAEQHTPFQSHEDPTALSGATLADIEEQLRASLGKISLASAKLSKLPQECTFTISIELKGDAPAPVGHTSPWVPSEERPVSKTGEKAPLVKTSGSKTTPIRTVEAGALFMEMWIEESKFKEKAVSSSKP